jgi:tRNA U38,U39,U40 pseudouridine synthase TruA
MKKVNKEKTVLTKVTLKTVNNGYLLDVEGEGYMYFNEQTMVEGICIHIGQGRKGSMTTEQIRNLMEATKDGSIVKKLQAEVVELKKQCTELQKALKELQKEKI